MINFIQNNSLLLILIAVVLIAVIVFLLIRVLKSSDKDRNLDIANNDSKKSESNALDSVLNQEHSNENEKEDSENKKSSKKKPKKEIEQVFKSPKKENETTTSSVVDDRIKEEEANLLDRMQFVSSTKQVSKLAKREKIEKLPESEFTEEELLEFGTVFAEEQEKLDKYEAKKHHHFDRSIRLSNFSKSGDYSSMFVSHISDNKKEHLNFKKHLHINEDFVNKIYERTYKTLERSGIKSENGDDFFEIDADDMFSLRKKKGYDEIDTSIVDEHILFPELYEGSEETAEIRKISKGIDLKSENIMVVDSLMHRKDNFKRKK